MSSLVNKTNNKLVSINFLFDVAFFLYLCTLLGNKTGEGFDAIILRATFVFAVGMGVFIFIHTNQLKFNGYLAWILVFFGYAYLSILWAISSDKAMDINNRFVQILFFAIFLTNRIKTHEEIIRYLKITVWASVYSAIVLLIKTPLSDFGSERIGEAIGVNPNFFGVRIAIACVISLYLFLKNKKNFLYALFSIGFLLLVIFTASRRSLFFILFSVCLYVFIKNLFASKEKNAPKKFLNILFAIFLLLCVYYLIMNIPFLYDTIGYRIDIGIENIGTDVGDGSIEERAYYEKTAIELFWKSPAIGVGLNGFAGYLSKIGYRHVAYSHNNYLELLCTLGLIGFTIFYSMMVYLIIKLFRLALVSKNDLSAFLLSILIAINFIGMWNVFYHNEFIYLPIVFSYILIIINKDVLKKGRVKHEK